MKWINEECKNKIIAHGCVCSNCPNCGKEISIEYFQDEEDSFCSNECRYEYERRKKINST